MLLSVVRDRSSRNDRERQDVSERAKSGDWRFWREGWDLILHHRFFSSLVDSTTLAYVLSTLNKRYNYGLDLYLLSIDEGIVGYRDDSLVTVKQNAIDYGLPLETISYKVGDNVNNH